MNSTTAAPKRRLKLKTMTATDVLRLRAGTPAEPPGDPTAGGRFKKVGKSFAALVPAKPPKKKRTPPAAPREDEGAKVARQQAEADRVAKAEAAARKGKDVALELSIRDYFGQRHVEWLERVARKEGRTLAQMLDRIVRQAWAKDPTKGGIFEDARGTGTGEGGVTGAHPAGKGE